MAAGVLDSQYICLLSWQSKRDSKECLRLCGKERYQNLQESLQMINESGLEENTATGRRKDIRSFRQPAQSKIVGVLL